jgi:hypothetical protein
MKNILKVVVAAALVLSAVSANAFIPIVPPPVHASR